MSEIYARLRKGWERQKRGKGASAKTAKTQEHNRASEKGREKRKGIEKEKEKHEG